MGEALEIQLEDGTTFEAVLEGDLTDDDVLRSLGRLRIVVDDQDVEGHGAAAALDVIVYGPDDVEGHAMTLKLPHAEAARDLQRKLLAAGVAGVIIVGAATTSIWVADSGARTATDTGTAATVAAAPADRGLLAEQRDGLLRATVPAAVAPVDRGLVAEQHDGLLAAEAATAATSQTARTAPVDRGLLAEQHDGSLAADAAAAAPAGEAAPGTGQGMRPE
jgi:hypothetical protein